MMRKFILLLPILLFVLSCNKDDDDNANDTDISLVNTVWIGKNSEDGTYTFSSNTEFRFVDQGEPPVDGTYTFDGSNGILTEDTGFTAPFSVSGGIMSVEGVNGVIRVYIRQ